MERCAERGSAFAASRAVIPSADTASIRFLAHKAIHMERRVFLAILLSFVVFYGYQTLFLPPPAPASDTSKPVPATAAPATVASEAPAAAPVSSTPEPAAVVSEASEREVVVDTATVQAVLTNRGGRLLHWRLKEYRDSQGEPVDLIPSALPADQPRPFSLAVEDARITQRLNSAVYRITGDNNGTLDARTTAATLVFEYQNAEGLQARKEFRFDPRNYVVVFSATVSSGGQNLKPAILWGPGLGDIGAMTGGGSFFTGNYVQPPQAIVHRAGKVERITPGDLATQPAHEGDFRFAGVDDHYFLAAILNPGYARLEYQPLTVPGPDNTQRQLLGESIRLRRDPQNVRVFIGPKQFDLLRSIDSELVRTINYGMFAVVVVPLLTTLKWLYQYIGNYGLAIIVLTILINLAMFPLRHKSVVAMRKMQQIQPLMKAIQDRYSHLKVTDPARQKMQTEIMSLYREKGVNPASGCLPMLLTMPVLLAFYSLLSMSIELRGAPLGGWIHDLSAPDPLYVIPALMGITMFWQQKITPSTADPAQQRVMMIMPVMFTGMMLFSPSGVVLYWFVSNLWAIGQQYFTNWLLGAPVVRPPAERRLKNAGKGKTPVADKP
jgi:YidC/Oxa1 family membrane protein insertase